MNIKVKYFDKEIEKLERISIGDWIDLHAAETVELKEGEFALISLGIGMKLPEGYEAWVVPRSSTFKNFGVLQTNSFGVIDNSYCGDNDCWKFPALAVRDTVIRKGDRICQFRIAKNQPDIEFEEVEHLSSSSRGGSVVQECEYKMKENKGVVVGLLFIACIIVLVCCVNSQSVTTNSDLKLFEKYKDYEVVTARLLGSSKGYENETPAPYGYRVGEKSMK